MSLGPLMIDLKGTSLSEQERVWLQEPVVGGVILFSRNFVDLEQLRYLVDEIHDIRDPALLVAVDQEGGRVQRFREPFTVLPPMASLGRLYDKDTSQALEAAHLFGWTMASELRAMGVDISFAPVVDLDRGLAEVIGDRALHREAEGVSKLALQIAAGMHRAGMCVVAKHFPSHAGVTVDSHEQLPVDHRPLGGLSDDLVPYQHLIEAGIEGVMLGHVQFPEVDARPASCSSYWIKEHLKAQMGFEGVVISDDIAMVGAAGSGSFGQRAEAALNAGADMVLLCNSPDKIFRVIDHLVDYGGDCEVMANLRGRDCRSWDTLRASDSWRKADERISILKNK